MLVWSGLGFLVIAIVAANAVVAQLITDTVTGDENFYAEHSLPSILSLYLSCLIIYFLGKWLNTRKAKVYIDKQSGEEVVLKNNHTFFFIRMEYWGMIIFVITIIYTVKEQF